MKYAELFKADFINGKGVRVSLFVSGCSHGCKGCYNKKAWSKNYGNIYTPALEDEIVDIVSKGSYAGLSLLGGEPLLFIKELLPLVKKVKALGKTVWCWTGYTWEEVQHLVEGPEFLNYIDILIDGKYLEDEKDLKLKFRGSANQRIINVQKSIEKGKVVEEEFSC